MINLVLPEKENKKNKIQLKKKKRQATGFGGRKTSFPVYILLERISSPLTFSCPVGRVSTAVRGSAPLLCCPTAARSQWAPLPASPWGKGVFFSPSHPAAREVCAPSRRAIYGNTCLHGFMSGPSLSSLLPEKQHFLLVRASIQGSVDRGVAPAHHHSAPQGSWPRWPFLCLAGPWRRRAFNSTGGGSP